MIGAGPTALPVSGAVVDVRLPDGTPRALAVLMHGAGSGTDVPVLRLLADLLVAAGVAVARLEQAYRVAGRRMPDRADRLDAALHEAVVALRGRPELARPVPLLLAGRSSGARIACRTAADVRAAGVAALGFPLRPPAGAGARPKPSRLPELLGAAVPVLVVQGERDSFGIPAPAPGIEVHLVAGADHVLAARRVDGRTTAGCVAEAATVAAGWLLALVSRS